MNGKYPYRHAEAALARVFSVEPEEIGAFRGRLRHLRNIGVPDLPKPGSGRQIEYSRQNIIEMMLALEFEAMGISPRYAALFAKQFVKQVASDGAPKADMILVTDTRPFSRPNRTVISAQTMRRWIEWIREQDSFPGRFAIVNVARSMAELDDALRAISPG